MLICETQRLRLKQLSAADAPFILELLNDPGFLRNIGDRGVRTLEDAQHYIRTGPRASYEQFGFGLWLVEQTQPLAPVGICGLLRRDSHPDVELGFAFLPAGRGKGYATEAARAVIDFGRHSLGLQRIAAITAPDNRDSIKVLEKLGFRYEGLASLTAQSAPSRLFALRDLSTQP